MTNSILKRLAAKGYITVQKINGRTMQYAITPDGTREIARRSYRYMHSTIGNVARWKHSIDHAVIQAKHNGAATIQLIGDSDLAFMVEHSGQRHGLRFTTSPHIPAHSPAQTGKAAQAGNTARAGNTAQAVFVSEHHEPPLHHPSRLKQQPQRRCWRPPGCAYPACSRAAGHSPQTPAAPPEGACKHY